MSLSTARGRSRPEVTSHVDRTTTVFSSCFVESYRLSCTVSTLIAHFVLPKFGGRTISAARGRVTPEMKSPFNFLSSILYFMPILYGSTFEFSGYLSFF
jgi:hypothetical protein